MISQEPIKFGGKSDSVSLVSCLSDADAIEQHSGWGPRRVLEKSLRSK